MTPAEAPAGCDVVGVKNVSDAPNINRSVTTSGQYQGSRLIHGPGRLFSRGSNAS